MNPTVIIIYVLGVVFALAPLACIVVSRWLERRDARRPPIQEHEESFWQ